MRMGSRQRARGQRGGESDPTAQREDVGSEGVPREEQPRDRERRRSCKR